MSASGDRNLKVTSANQDVNCVRKITKNTEELRTDDADISATYT